MRTRGGAAAWVKAKVASLKPMVLPSYKSVTFAPRQLARKIAVELAERWKAQIFQINKMAGFEVDFARSAFDGA